MNLYLKYDPIITMERFLEDLLINMGIPFKKISAFNVQIDPGVKKEELKLVENFLAKYKIEINGNHQEQLVLQIRECVREMIINNSMEKTSDVLECKMPYSYSYLSRVFKENTFISLEQYIIFERIEYAKELFIKENLSISDIAHRMNYSSVSHLSAQFKKITGTTFSEYQNIINTRRNLQKQ